MIDIHIHLYVTGRMPDQPRALTPEQLVDAMNRNGIDQSVLLPIESPDAQVSRYFLSEEAVAASQQYPERQTLPLHCQYQPCAEDGDGQKAGYLEIIDHEKWCVGAERVASAGQVFPLAIAMGQQG